MVDSCGSLRVLNLCETLPSWREFTTTNTLIYLVDTVVLDRGESACLPRAVYPFCCKLCIVVLWVVHWWHVWSSFTNSLLKLQNALLVNALCVKISVIVEWIELRFRLQLWTTSGLCSTLEGREPTHFLNLQTIEETECCVQTRRDHSNQSWEFVEYWRSLVERDCAAVKYSLRDATCHLSWDSVEKWSCA